MGTFQCCRRSEPLETQENNDDIDNNEKKENKIIVKKPKQSLKTKQTMFLDNNNIKQTDLYPWNEFYLSIENNLYLQITIESITLYYDNCDDYGLVFQPFITASINNDQSLQEIFHSNPNDKLNISTLSNCNIDESNNNNQPIKLNSFMNACYDNSSNRKTFTFEQTKILHLTKDKFFGIIIFTLKNINWIQGNSDNQKHSLCNHSIIAKSKMNLLDLIINQQRFDGLITLKQRDTYIIGTVKIKMILSTNKLADSSPKTNDNSINANKDIKDNKPKEINCFNDSPCHFFMYEKNFFPYIEGDHTEEILNIISKVDKPFFDYEFLMKQYKTLKVGNQISIWLINGYEMLLYLYRVSLIDKNFKEIDNFLNQIDLTLIIKYVQMMKQNPYVIKVYLMFLINYFKGIKSCDSPIEPQIQEEIVIEQIIEIYALVKEKKENMQLQLLNEEIIFLILNFIIELLYLPRKIQLFYYDTQIKTKEKLFDFSNRLYTALSGILWTIFEDYFDNSEIVFLVTRIFRKIIQNYEDPKIMEYQKINGYDVNEYKIKFINYNNGSILENILKVIKVYYHYPGLITNVLKILVILTREINTNVLLYTIEKISLSEIAKHLIYYIGKLRCISRNINEYYLKYLANLSELAKSKDYKDVFTLVEDDIRIENSKSYNKEYEHQLSMIGIELIFYLSNAKKEKLLYENTAKFITLHQIISIISLNITLYPSIAYDLLERDKKSWKQEEKSEFYYECFRFIKNIKAMSKMPNKDFLSDTITLARKGIKIEDIERIILSTIENNLAILYNVLITDSTAQGVYNILDGDNTDKYKISDHLEVITKQNKHKTSIDNVLGELLNYFVLKNINFKQLKRIKECYDNLFNDSEDDELE